MNVARLLSASPALTIRGSSLRADAAAPFWGLVWLIMLGSFLLRQDGATPDVSWLTSMCERMLDGEKGWVDIFETTPPVPTLIYMPGVYLARVFGVSSELAVFATTYAATIFTLAFTQRLLPEKIEGSGPSRWVVTFPAALFLFLLSDDAFAEREYFAAAFSLPIFAVFLHRAQENEWPGARDRFVAAALAGLAFAIKPPLFALPFMAIGAFEWARTRSLRFLFPSFLPAAAAVGVLFTAASLAAFPAYLGGVTTLMRDIYVPLRAAPIFALTIAFCGTALCAASSLVFIGRRHVPAGAGLCLILTAAYAGIYYVQGKFFPYHILPASLFALIAFAISVWPLRRAGAENARAYRIRAGLGVAVALITAAMFVRGFDDEKPRMRDLSWANSFDHPTAMAISPDISVGFPLAEHIHARWVDRIHGQWVVKYARMALLRPGLSETDERLFRGYYDRELERTRALIRDKKPELIIECVSKSCTWLPEALLAGDPHLLDDYAPIAQEGVIRVLRRR